MPTEPTARVDISAIVLAAGEGRRFDPTGTRFKLTESLPDDPGGRKVIAVVVERYANSVDEVIIVAGSRKTAIAEALPDPASRLVYCRDAAEGMAASIRCGVQASAPDTGWLVALGDMPFVQTSTIRAIGAALRAGALIARPFYQGRPGHPVGFSVALRTELSNVSGEEGARALIQQHVADLQVINVGDAGCVRDIDFPADLAPPP